MPQAHSENVKAAYAELKKRFGASFDLNVEFLYTAREEAILCYVDGFINKDLLHRDIIAPLKSAEFRGAIEQVVRSTVRPVEELNLFVRDVLEGFLGLYYAEKYYLIDIKQWEKRGIETPDAESVTRGPKEGFTEDLITNTVLLRRKIRNENFRMENMKMGQQTNTTVVVSYLEGIANPNVVASVKRKLKAIQVDGVLDAGKLEQYLDGHNFSTVSGLGMSQKPDIVARRVLEGRVAILCDGTPHVLTVPELFIENIHSAEDYYHRPLYGSFLRLLRMLGLIISLLLPGIAAAVSTFNQEMLTSSYFIRIVASVESTPFPQAVEIFFLMIMLELLKESGTRLPKTIGSAVSIVGALIIGDAAVRAGIVGAPTVMIVALTAVCSFIIPNLNEFTTIYRLAFLALGATFGMVGLGIGIFIMAVQLCGVDTFGVSIMSFFTKEELKDSFVRFPIGSLKFRPKTIARENIRRSE